VHLDADVATTRRVTRSPQAVMPRPKILVAVGTRPEAVKLAPVVHTLRAAPWCDCRVLATAQHRDLLDSILAFFEIEPDIDLDLMQPGQTLADLTARMTTALDRALAEERPDVVLGQGDTTTVFVTALASFYRDIPFGHVEAGLRTHLRRSPFPEEMNRQLVGRLADWHFAPTERSANNLRQENVDPAAIHVTGNTVVDALLWAAERVPPSDLAPRDGRKLVLVTAHRRENFGERFAGVCGALREIADREDVHMVYPVHPNPNIREPAARLLGDHPHIDLIDPLDYPRFVAAMRAARVILTDSGGVQEEAPSLGVPVLVLRDDTERPEGIDAGTAELVGTDPARIVARATTLLEDDDAHRTMAQKVNPYGDGTASQRIADVLRAQLVD
jgi:UDP-N-acetylglucosamine 2-epimerase (non-hydrolysing)